VWGVLNAKFSCMVGFSSKGPRDSFVHLHLFLSYIIVVEQMEHVWIHGSFLKTGV
jgi:hypothetical protein